MRHAYSNIFLLLLLALIPVAAVCVEDKPHGGDAIKPADDKPVDKGPLPVLGLALLDGFEGPDATLWAFDSADDEGDAAYVEEGSSQGKKALKITLRDKGVKGKIHLRRDVDLDLSRASALVVDITSPASTMTAALALKNDPGDIWQEIKPVSLKKGLNKDVRFELEGTSWKNEKSKWEFNGPPVNLAKTKRLILLLFTGEQESGSFLIDNLRVEGEASDSKGAGAARAYYREWRPEILFTDGPPEATTQYAGVEQQIVFRASYRDLFDANDIVVGWRVTTPSGRTLDVRGFFGGLAKAKLPLRPEAFAPAPLWGPYFMPRTKEEKEAKDPPPLKPDLLPTDVLPLWLVRFTPQETGRYTAQLYVRNQAGETRDKETSFVVTAEVKDAKSPGRAGGNVRVSKKDPTQLELQDGSPFYITGQNVAWSQNFTPYVEKIKQYGGNTCRIWLCPWGISLERKTDAGAYDLKEAERIDRLIAQAEATGVRIIFCFTFHNLLADNWNESPYNAANGGPCPRPEDFFFNWMARRQFKRLLSYGVARWGSSPAILSWELINEADLAKFDNAEDVLAWTREMAGHLKSIDPHNHLVTTSVSKPSFLPEMFQDGRIDWINVHGYGPEVSNLLRLSFTPLRMNKPLLLAEYGGGWRATDDLPDKEGARLQAALWLSACSPSCGTVLPWWWDTYIEARNLYPVMAAAAKFTAGEDRRGRYSEWVKKSYDSGVEVNGVMDNQGARLYVYHPGWTKTPESRAEPLLKTALPLELSGIYDGAYRVELWDAREGKVFETREATAAGGKLTIELPARAKEFGMKIDRKELSRPDLK